MLAARPYARKMREVVGAVAGRAGAVAHPLLTAREPRKLALLLVTSDRGLCGGFNSTIVREAALIAALKSGQVAAAGLDVFENEPLTDRKLFELPQVIGSPHIGASTKEATARIGDEVADILITINQEGCQ